MNEGERIARLERVVSAQSAEILELRTMLLALIPPAPPRVFVADPLGNVRIGEPGPYSDMSR